MFSAKKRKMELSTPEDVIAKFHNLEGDLINERRKSFFTLLKIASQRLTLVEMDNVIDNLNPKSYQQRLFWVEALVYLKKTEHLIQVLKDCNRDHIKIAIRQSWFICEAFKDMAPNTLVNEFFPEVSYSTRLKLLWRIPHYWSEEKNDDLFNCVQERYGVFIALTVLQACTATTIKNVLEQHEPVLTTSQVLHLLNRSEELFTIYLNHWQRAFRKPYEEKNVINILATKHTELYLQLEHNKKICSQKLTSAASNSVLRVIKEDIFQDSHKYFKLLNTRRLVKSIGSKFKTFCGHIMPKKIEDLKANCSFLQILKYFPKKGRWELFTQLFSIAFPHKSTNNFLEIIDSSIFQLHPSKEAIYHWAKNKYENSADDDFLQYYPTSLSIPIIKEKINVCSDMRDRQTLIKLLISTCAQNQDMASLDKVLDYIYLRHKNEEPHAYMRQVQFLLKTFKPEELTKDHWHFVQQQLTLMRAKGVLHVIDYVGIEVTFLEYAYKNNIEAFKLEATEFLKCACDLSWNFKRDFGNSKLEHELFLELLSLFIKVIPPTRDHYNRVQCSFITDLVELCEKYPQKCINISNYPEFLPTIEASFEKRNAFSYDDIQIITSVITYIIHFPQYTLSFLNDSKLLELLTVIEETQLWLLVQTLVTTKNCSTLEKKIVRLLLEHLSKDTWLYNHLVNKLVLRQPQLLVNYVETIAYSIDFCKEIKHYSHLGLDKTVCNFLINKWSQIPPEKQETVLKLLINLLDEDEFIKFYDEKLKIISEDPAHGDILHNQIQIQVISLFKDVLEPRSYISLLLKSCARNFDQNALSSVYNLFARSPEKELYSNLEIMSKQNLQMQQCSVILSSEFLDQTSATKLLKTINPRSYPTLKFLCLRSLKNYVKFYSEDLFTLFTNCTGMFEEYDRKIFSTFIKVKVSKKHASQYIETCWKMIERFMDEKKKSYHYLDKLLERALNQQIIKALSSTFVKNILTRYLSEEGDNRLSNINYFAILYLAYREQERTNNYKVIFDILNKLSKRNINLFCNAFLKYQNKIKNDLFLNDFVQHWMHNFAFNHAINEHIILNLLLKSNNASKENFAISAVDYLEQLIAEQNQCVYLLYARSFEEFLSKSKQFQIYEILHLMLLYKPTTTIFIFVLNLLKPVSNEENEEVKTIYRSILDVLKVSEDSIVKCYYNQYIACS